MLEKEQADATNVLLLKVTETPRCVLTSSPSGVRMNLIDRVAIHTAVTRGDTEASAAPSSAAAEEAGPLGDFGDLVVEQSDDNSTDIDTAPTPALHDPLPAGMPQLYTHTVFAACDHSCLQSLSATRSKSNCMSHLVPG